MATMTTVDGQFILQHTISNAGTQGILLSTENKFVDKNIGINIYTPNASSPTLEMTDKTAIINMGTPSDGVYNPKLDLDGTLQFSSAGWVTANTMQVVDHTVSIGKINQSTLKNGTTAISSGHTVNPSDVYQTINISEGYNSARTVVVGPASASAPGGVTSGTASLGTLTFTHTNNQFNVSGTATIGAPTVQTAGYIGESTGTRSGNSNTVTQTVGKIGVGVTVSGGAAATPSISKQAFTISGVTDAASGDASTDTPATGVYVKVKSGATNSTVSSTGKVTSAGYGTTAYYTAANPTITTVTVNASPDTYIPIKTGAYNATVHTHKVDAPVINRTIGGTITNIGQTTKPSGTDGTNYWTISPSGTTTAGTSTAAGKANITTAGYILTGNTTSANSTVAINPTINDSGTRYILKGTITNNTSGGTSAGTINRGSQIKIGAGYYTADAYYTAQTNSGNKEITSSGSTSVDGYATASVAAASFTNHTVSGQNYTDISSDNDAAPVLISGDYLYINAGYTSAKKISLARLVPDSIGINTTFATSNKMLANYVGFNANGEGVVGTIGTYDGTYSIT